MKMKSWALIALFVALLASCQEPSEKTTVTVKIKAANPPTAQATVTSVTEVRVLPMKIVPVPIKPVGQKESSPPKQQSAPAGAPRPSAKAGSPAPIRPSEQAKVETPKSPTTESPTRAVPQRKQPTPAKDEISKTKSSKKLRPQIEPLLVEGRPLLWVDQDAQYFMLVERRGNDAVVILDGRCTTGRNSRMGGESLPTPSTVDKDGNITFTTIVRKDVVRPGIGLPYAMELNFRDTRGQLRSICVHVGTLREYPASHGCIRVNPSDGKDLFTHMKVGDRVVITGIAESDNPYIVYHRKPSGESVPVFKAATEGATEEDIVALKELLRNKGVPLDNGPFGKLSTDKDVIRFRFEHMPAGTGITVSTVEKLLGISMNIGPTRMTRQPRS